ncbi:MAG TPA: four helix bundle protein [Longimicrobiales bacterium]|nr:four helix bundle protein [Longimicrobiales bacterium]
MPLFEHQRLDVYVAARDYAIAADAVCRGFPPGRGYFIDQLTRAGASIVLNIAEGCGEFSPRDKARFYRMARRSATESAAILDLLRGFGEIAAEEVRPCEELLARIVAMLTAMVRRLDEAGRGGTVVPRAPGEARRKQTGSGSAPAALGSGSNSKNPRSRSAPAGLRSRSEPAG